MPLVPPPLAPPLIAKVLAVALALELLLVLLLLLRPLPQTWGSVLRQQQRLPPSSLPLVAPRTPSLRQRQHILRLLGPQQIASFHLSRWHLLPLLLLLLLLLHLPMPMLLLLLVLLL